MEPLTYLVFMNLNVNEYVLCAILRGIIEITVNDVGMYTCGGGLFQSQTICEYSRARGFARFPDFFYYFKININEWPLAPKGYFCPSLFNGTRQVVDRYSAGLKKLLDN